MKNLVLKVITFTIILGIIALAINHAFGSATFVYLRRVNVFYLNGEPQYMWKLDLWNYVKNIQTTASNPSVLQFELPTRQWDSTVQSYQDFTNNLALVVDYIIVVLNVLLYPLKVGSYLLQNILAILGINTNTSDPNNGLAWLIIFVRDMLSRVVIPYI